MDLVAYRKLYPKQNVHSSVLTSTDGTSAIVMEGMLKFDDSACDWAGPFEGDYAHFALFDERNLPGTNKLKTLAQLREAARFCHYNMPRSAGFHNPATSEEQLQKRLKDLTPKELREWEAKVAAWHPEHAWIECPFTLYLCGNDDCSYSKWFPTLEAALEEIELFLACEPLNMQRDIRDNGFFFTN